MGMRKRHSGTPITPAWRKVREKVKPAAVSPARAPLPENFFGRFIKLESFPGDDNFTLWCLLEAGSQEPVSYDLTEEETRALLRAWRFPEIPRIISTARYARAVQVVPNFGGPAPLQVIGLFPRKPSVELDWGDDQDNRPVHAIPSPLPVGNFRQD